MRRIALSAVAAGLVVAMAAPTSAVGMSSPGEPAVVEKRVAWQQLLHQGNSAQARSVAIHGGLVTAAGFTTTEKSSPRMAVRTYRLSTGEAVWSDALPGVSVAQDVAAADGIVGVAGFTLTNGQASGFVVRAYDARTGKLLWTDAKAADRDHQGHAQAIAISGGRIYAAGYVGACPFLGEPGCVATMRAYDAKSGNLIWESFSGLGTGFSAFTALTVVDGQVIAVGGSSDLLRLYESGLLVQAYDAESGLLNWQAPVQPAKTPGAGGYEIATSVAAGQGLVAVGGKFGDLRTMAFGVRTFDVETGLPRWADTVPGAPGRADTVNALAFTDKRLVAVGLSSKDSGAQTYLVRAYDPATGEMSWTDRVSSAEKKMATASENDDHSNQLESALVVVARGSRAYVTGRIGENCDGVAPGNCDMLVRAYDEESGRHVWSDRFDRAGYDDVGQAAALSNDRLVVSGRSTSTNRYGYQAYWMVRAYKP